MPRVHNDEASSVDSLNRKAFVTALADVAKTCETPLVIGLHGRWGTGKTSMLRQIEDELRGEPKLRCVRFDAWHHQHDEFPAVGLLQQIVEGKALDESVKKSLYAGLRAIAGWALQTTVNIDADKIASYLEAYESQFLKSQEKVAQIRNEIIKSVEPTDGSRVVIMVDDLDRCLPEKVVATLEAIKLFLNIKGCVYFLAADRKAIESAITSHYSEGDLDGVSYLDKVVQLPFELPEIGYQEYNSYLQSLLPRAIVEGDTVDFLGDLLKALPRNPRSIKRFVNTLSLMYAVVDHEVAGAPQTDLLALLLVLQERSPDLFAEFVADPDLLHSFQDGFDEHPRLKEAHASEVEQLSEIAAKVKLPGNEDLYSYLRSARNVSSEEVESFDESGFYTEEGIDRLLRESVYDRGEQTYGRVLLYSTVRQRTWLIASNKRLCCLLDDEKTRAAGRVLQWHTPIATFDTAVVRARQSANRKGNWVIDLGRKAPWLYSSDLHRNPDELRKQVVDLVNEAKAVGD